MTKISLHKPLLIMLYGFPGSGKTHFSRQLSEAINLAHLDADRIRKELLEKPPFDRADDEAMGQLMDYMALEFLRAGVSVAYDTNATTAVQRRRLRELAHRAKTSFLLVWLQIDSDSAYARTQRRDRRKGEDKYARSLDKEAFKEILGGMQNPKSEDYIVISGKHTFNTQRNTVLKKLYEMALIDPEAANGKLAKPALVNLVPNSPVRTRFNVTRRDIVIR